MPRLCDPGRIADAVREKQQQEQAETAKLIARERRSPAPTPASTAA